MKVQIKDQGKGLKYAFINPQTNAPLSKVSQTMRQGAISIDEARKILIAGGYEIVNDQPVIVNTELLYTTSDSAMSLDITTTQFDRPLLSHTYGRLVFDGALTEVGAAFEYNSTLRKIVLPDTVVRLGSSFQYSGLSEITLSPILKEIGMGTFTNCTNLIHVNIPATIEVIDELAFFGCSNLHTVIINTVTPPDPAGGTFEGCAADMVIKVPAEAVDAYKSTWSMYADHIQAI